MSDISNFFSSYSLKEVHDWYMDLAKKISALAGTQSTAPKLLEYYLSPDVQKSNQKVIDFCENEIEGKLTEKGEPNYFGIYTNRKAGFYEDISENYINKIKSYTEYKSGMNDMLNIFLSKKNKSKGIIKHIKDKGIKKDDQNEYELTWYKSLGFSESDKVLKLLPLAASLRFNSNLSQADKDRLDVYVGLNTYAIKATVTIVVKKVLFNKVESTETETQNKIKSVIVSIKSWKNILFDYYDFNKDIGFPLPNPHYKTGKIHPEIQNVSHEQTHSKLVEMTKCTPLLARPFYVYKEFSENDPSLLVQDKEIIF